MAKDIFGKQIHVGDEILVPIPYNKTAYLMLAEVTKISETRVYWSGVTKRRNVRKHYSTASSVYKLDE